MIYRARTESNEMFIAMYETPRPPSWKYYFEQKGIPFDDKVVDEWQSSKREYKVRKEYEIVLINELWIKFAPEYVAKFGDEYSEEKENFYKKLSIGIDCTFLKNRLKVEKFCQDEHHNRINERIKKVGHCFGLQKPCTCQKLEYWTLLPLEDKNVEPINFENFKKQFNESFGKVTPQEFVKEMESLGYEFKSSEDKKENEAVEFAEWIFKSGYVINVKGLYNHKDDFYRDTHYTTSELYQIFNNPNKQ